MTMRFEKPRLPYVPDALEPSISQETVNYHYGKHEQAYIDTLNALLPGTEYENLSLEEIIRNSDGAIFNNASQAYNHIFYFFQFSPYGRREPVGDLRDKIEEQFESVENFKEKIEEAGKTLFGSGWVWLAMDEEKNLFVIQGKNAENPLTRGLIPLMVVDVWEHAYYLDYQNLRATYLHKIWDIMDWNVIEQRYKI